MKYFALEPEVAGGFGSASVLDPTTRPPKVDKFNYEFDVWLGDPILEAISCYIVTDSLKDRLVTANASGVAFDLVEVTKSGEFQDLHPEILLPQFSWLKVNGVPGVDDFGLSAVGSLVVSERILDVLKACGMRHCDITVFEANN